MNKIIILSDIHANLSALQAVLCDISLKYSPDAFAILGDNINYGVHPNEVIDTLKLIPFPIIVNLAGNHERAILDSNLDNFSTERGRELLKYTKSILVDQSLQYMISKLSQEGYSTTYIMGKKVLFMHGDIDDPLWGKFTIDQIKDIRYQEYDYVISGHTHLPHHIEAYYSVDNPQMRNKKKTIFINPGSVGQPRNQNPYAQYSYIEFDKELVHHNAVFYDIDAERKLYPESLDIFYSERLVFGV